MTSTPIVQASHWFEAVLIGPFAVAIAVIAVASVGLMLMRGTIDVRRALQVIGGCFIIFGAPTIAAGLMQALIGGNMSAESETPPGSTPVPTAAVPQSVNAYDPYAGAAVPRR